ncbi:MAG: HAMP domain-containing sensor histidine kinase [Phormidesmis sp.]
MSAIASPEFVSLCQSQLQLLTQRLSESAAALYIADVSTPGDKQTNFVPVVSYPDPVDRWVANFERATPWSNAGASGQLALPGAATGSDLGSDLGLKPSPQPSVRSAASQPAAKHTEHAASESASEYTFKWPDVLRPDQQLVMPLIYTDVVVGLLVAVRLDRAWLSEERRYIERVAQSLAGGCVLERRNQWLQSQLAQKNGLQSRQSEIFHNLLHQFRNPLTAVSTFGQLLVKRLGPEDPNQSVATGIVRENKRLRELVSHFDEAVAIGDTNLSADLSAEMSIETVDGTQQLSKLPLSGSAKQPLLLAESQRDSLKADLQDLQATDLATHQLTSLGHRLALSAQYLPDIVDPVLAVAAIVASEKGVSLRSQVASDTPVVWGEEEALGEVVSNLVDNAIKYSSPFRPKEYSETHLDAELHKAEVWVQTGVSRVGKVGHYQGVVVGDTGPGIPKGDLERLFERNYRGVQAQGSIPGTGLGLAIARSLVGEMQGRIEVISPAVGTPWMPSEIRSAGPGTVFIVWLLEVDRAPPAAS